MSRKYTVPSRFARCNAFSPNRNENQMADSLPGARRPCIDLISTISDPEHPLSLGELAVINLPHIHVTHKQPTPTNPHPTSLVLVEITPTINHCSLATVIGLGVRVRLEQALPPRFRVDVRIREGTHQSTDQVNKIGRASCRER